MMIGQTFPVQQLPAVMADGTTNKAYDFVNTDGYTVVFFYPLDFTFVCPTELVEYNTKLEQFEALNTRVVSCSVDSTHSHTAWRKASLKDGGIGEVGYPMLSDMQRTLSSQLGILNEEGVTYRASYLLDSKGVIRHMVVNDIPLGRSVDEMLRMVDALTFFEAHGEVCPAGWMRGNSGIKATRESAAAHIVSKAA
jgi:peroxiredoxin 2/4